MTLTFAAAALLALLSCEDPFVAPVPERMNVEGLRDCLSYSIGLTRIIRCPNSSTTAKTYCGKSCLRTVVVIDGGAVDAEAR